MIKSLGRYLFIGITVILSIPLFLFLVSIALHFAQFTPTTRVIGISTVLILTIAHLIFIIFTTYYFSAQIEIVELTRKIFFMLACLSVFAAISDLVRLFSLMVGLRPLQPTLQDLWGFNDALIVGGGLLLGLIFGYITYLQKKIVQSSRSFS